VIPAARQPSRNPNRDPPGARGHLTRNEPGPDAPQGRRSTRASARSGSGPRSPRVKCRALNRPS
jgi:hypothetical protein